MTEKEVKAYLNRANGLDRTVRFLEDEIRRTKLLAQCYGSMDNSERVQTSGRVEAIFAELTNEAVDRERELKKIIVDKLKVIDDIMRVIMTLESNEEQQVLLYKYVEGLRYYEVHKKAHMSKSTMYRVEKRAIRKLAKNWENLGIES